MYASAHRIGLGPHQTPFELAPAIVLVVKEVLRCRRIKRFGAIAKALADEDGTSLLGTLFLNRCVVAHGKDAAGQGGDKYVGFKAHYSVIAAADGIVKRK